MPEPLHVLLVERSATDAGLILQELRRGGFAPVHERVTTLPAARKALDAHPWDLLISDIALPYLSVLEEIRRRGLHLPVLAVSGPAGEAAAVAALRAGVRDVLPKGDLARLVPVVHRELRDVAGRRADVRSAAILRRLQDVLALLNRSDTLDQVADLSVQAALDMLDCDASGLAVVERDGALRHAAVRGVSVDALARLPGSPLASRVVRENRTVCRTARSTEPDLRQAAQVLGTRSAAAVPCRSEGRVVAVLSAGSRGWDEFDTVAVQALQALGDAVGIAVARARLVERERDAARRREALDAVLDATLAHAGDAQAVLQALVERLVEATDIAGASAFLVDESGVLQRRAASNLPASLAGATTWWLGSSTADQPLAEGRSVYVSDVQAEPGIIGERLRGSGLRSVLAVPMRAGGAAIGVLVAFTREVRSFAPEEVRLIEVAADRAAAVIEQARLVERLREQTYIAQRLVGVSAELNRATGVGEVAATLVGALSYTLPVSGCRVILHDQGSEVWRVVGANAAGDDSVRESEAGGQPLPAETAHVLAALAPGAITAEVEDDALFVPLAAQDAIIGAVELLGIAEMPDRRTQALVLGIAAQGAVALTNALFQQQAAAAAAAVQADRLKTELLNTVSHELRTPLAAIKGFSTTLLLYFGRLSDEEQLEFLREIDAASDRLIELVDNLLQLSRLEAGTLRIERAPVALSTVLQATIEEARRRYPTRTITLDVASGMPALLADARRLGQVAANLIDNAIKYSPNGGDIEVQAGPFPEGSLAFSVTDHGLGIAPEHHDKVFDRFYRVDNGLARDIGGTGLGLTISQRIVEEHGGRIALRSVEGAGSTFTVTLPLPR